MRLVHLSDLHLGFRQYARMTDRGINQREADVAASFSRAIAKTIELAPELVIIGGDLFHAVRPPNSALVHAAAQFKKLRAALPHTATIAVAGNHDTPRSTDTGGILRLLTLFGVHIVDGAARAIDLPQFDCEVLGVPDANHERPELRPTGKRRHNVLLLHGEAGGISPKGSPAAEKEIPDEQLHGSAWDYIALGHYHVHREVLPNAFYSGAIDYTSSNNWGEVVEERERGLQGKGIVERDLSSGAQTFHDLPKTRHYIDVPAIECADLSPAMLSERLAALAEQYPVDGNCVRVTLANAEKDLVHAIDTRALRDVRKRALHFQMVTRRPELMPVAAGAPAIFQRGRSRMPLSEIVRDKLERREIPPDIDRAELIALSDRYLAAAAEKEHPSIAEATQ